MAKDERNAENRLLAALAHGSVVAQGVGILVGILVYINQREQSPYSAFHALQATLYQLISFIITIILWVIWGIFYGLSMVPLIIQADSNPNAAPPLVFWLGMLSMVIPFIYMILVGLYGLWGGIRTWQGKDFRYAIIGSMLEKSDLWSEN